MNFLKSLVKKAKKIVWRKQNLALVAILFSFLYFSKAANHGIPYIKFSIFLTALSRNLLSDIYISKSTLKFKGPDTNWYQCDRDLISNKYFNKLMLNHPNVDILRSENILYTFNRSSFLIYGLAIVVIIQSLRFLKEVSTHSYYKQDKFLSSNIKFSDICGHENAKIELKQIIDFFSSSEPYLNIGARIKKGILLYGPTGTGKTVLAKV